MTHAYLGLAGLDLLATAVGYALLGGLGLVRMGRDLLPYFGLAFFSGWAATAAALALGESVGVDPDLSHVLLVSAALIAIFGFTARLSSPLVRRRPTRETSRLAKAAALVGGAVVVLTLAVDLRDGFQASADMSWDAWTFWLPKAEAIYYFHGLDTGLSGFTTYANPYYPPLVPAIDAATFHFMGGVYPMLLPLQQCLLFVGFVASVAALLKAVPRWILFPTLAMLVLAPQVQRQVFTVLPDDLLAYLLAVAAVAGILWLEDPRRAWLALAIVFLAAGALTKEEGVLLGSLLAIVVVGAGCAMRGRRALEGLALLLGPLAIEPWRLWLAAHHQPVSAAGVYSWSTFLHPIYLADHVGRLTYAVSHLIDLLRDPTRWSPILPLTIAALIFLAPRLRALSAAVGVWIVVAFFGLASVYWISTLNIEYYVSTSAYRVVGNIPIVAGAVLPLLLGIAVERDRAAR